MKSFKAAGAAVIAFGMIGPATAMPQIWSPAQSGDLVVKVAIDCHADIRRHYVPEYGGRIWHRHRQSNCRVIVVDPPDEEYDRPRDCHRDVVRHYLPEYGGSVAHRHLGESCRVKIYRPYEGGGSGGSCIRIGPITYCEN